MGRYYCDPAPLMKIISTRALLFLLFLLPALAHCKVSIRIDVGNDPNKVKAQVSGSVTEIIPDAERGVWRLNDQQMYDAVERYSGARPTDVYVKSPTPWNDLYKTFGWDQVQRTLVPINATILGVSSQPVFIMSKTYKNNREKSTYTFDVSRKVQETVSNTWSSQKELSIGQSIEYNINFLGSGVGGQTSLAYTAAWGHSQTKETTVSFGTAVGVEMELNKGQAVRCSIYATRGIMEIMVYYRATVDGVVACNYHNGHNGHNFWAYDVNVCLEANGSPTVIESSELIRIEHYSQGRLVVEDLDSTATQFQHVNLNAESVQPGLVYTQSSKPEQINTEVVTPDEVTLDFVKPEQVNTESVKLEQIDAESVKLEQVGTKPVKPEQINAASVTSE